MKVVLCLAATLLGALATPQGHYHQEYNYQSSASSYKNNELQHKTDDRGYYSKSGDLEGRTKPKVVSDSEHAEYVNPKIGYHGASINSLDGGYGSSLSAAKYNSLGQTVDNTGDYNRYYGSEGSQSSSNQYNSYGLSSIASRLESDLQQEISSALRSQYSQVAITQLEAELRQNLTSRLQELLRAQFGTQTIRGGQSYSLVAGHVQPRPNYDQHDLEAIQNRLENSLLQQLRREYYTRFSSSSPQYRPTYNIYQVDTTPYPTYYETRRPERYQEDQYNRIISNARYTPVANPLTITTIASNIQGQLDTQLNRFLENVESRYFSEHSAYSSQNLDAVLNNVKQELKNNLTYLLNDQIHDQYGKQIQRGGELYSVASSGQISDQSNYNSADLDNLRHRVENNLITKLTREFESAKQRWIERQQQNQYLNTNYENTDYYNTRRPSSNSYTKYGHQTSESSVDIANIQAQLQNQLSQQLQRAISKQYSASMSGSGYGSAASFDDVYQRLYAELQRNLTRQIDDFLSESGYWSSYGSNDGQVANLKSQLQNSLSSQLQQGLRQSFSASASYGASASSGSSGYSTSRKYRQASELESHSRSKRSYGHRTAPLGLSNHGGSSYGGSGYGGASYGSSSGSHYDGSRGYSGSAPPFHHRPFGNTQTGNIDDSQRVEPLTFGAQASVSGETQQQEELGQEPIEEGQEEMDLGQVPMEPGQEEDFSAWDSPSNQDFGGFSGLQVGSQATTTPRPSRPSYGTHQNHNAAFRPGGLEVPSAYQPDRGFQTFSSGHHDKPLRGDQTRPVSSSPSLPEYTGVEKSVSTLGVSYKIQRICSSIIQQYTRRIETVTTEKASQNDITRQAYEDVWGNLDNDIAAQCRKRFKHVSPEQYQSIEDLIKYNLYQKLVRELLEKGFTKEIIGLDGGSASTTTIIPSNPTKKPDSSSSFIQQELDAVNQQNFGGQSTPSTSSSTGQQPLSPEEQSKLLIDLLNSQKNKKPVNTLVYENVPYVAPTYQTLQTQISGLKRYQYDVIVELEEELYDHINKLIEAEVRIIGDQNLSPVAAYESVQHTLDTEIDSVVQGALTGNKIELRRYYAIIKNKLDRNQQQPAREYLDASLTDHVKQQLSRIYNVQPTTPTKPKYQAPTYEVLQNHISDLTVHQYEIIRDLEVELQPYIVQYFDREIKVAQQQGTPLDEIYALIYTLEEDIGKLSQGQVGQLELFRKYATSIEKEFTPKQQRELEVVLLELINTEAKLYGLQVPHQKKPVYQAPTFDIVKTQIPGVTPKEYQTISDLDAQLQDAVYKLVRDQVKFIKNQGKTPRESYTIVLYTLEAEIETLLQQTFTGTKPQYQTYTRFIRNELTKAQNKKLKEYLLNNLHESVEKQLSDVYGPEASRPSLPSYQSPQYEVVQSEVPGLTVENYETVKDLDVELQIQINKLIQDQVDRVKTQNKTPRESYVVVLHTLEAEIETLLQSTFSGTNRNLKQYSRFVKNKLDGSQSAQLKKYLRSVLTETLNKNLVDIYGPEATRPSLSSYTSPSLNEVQTHVPGVTPHVYDSIKDLDVELQIQVLKLIEKQVAQAETQNKSPREAYVTILQSLDGEIETLVHETFAGHKPELKMYYSVITSNLDQAQVEKLRDYLADILKESVNKKLTQVYGPEAARPNLPSYLSPNFNQVETHVPGIGPDTYETVKDLDVELQIEINKLIENQVKLFEQQHKTPRESYVTILHTLEAEIETLVQQTLTGNRPELQNYANVIKKKLDSVQNEKLREYLVTILNESVSKQLIDVYGPEAARPSLPSYQSPDYPAVQEHIPGITIQEYENVKDLDIELQRLINKLVENQIKETQQSPKTPRESYADNLHTLQTEIAMTVQQTLAGNKPELKPYSNFVNKLNKPQNENLETYLTDVLNKSVTKKLIEVYGLEASLPSYQVPKYETTQTQVPGITPNEFETVKDLDLELQVQINKLIENQVKELEHQSKTPREAYVIILHTLEAEIEMLVQQTFNGKRPELHKYTTFTNTLNQDQNKKLQQYLNDLLSESVTKQLTEVYGVEAARPSLPSYQSPVYPTVAFQVPGITPEQYEKIRDLDVELQIIIKNLIQNQVARQHDKTLRDSYVTVYGTVQDDIDTLLQQTFTGNKPELKQYYRFIQDKLNPVQRQKLQEYLNTILDESLRGELINVYGVEVSRPNLPSYKAPSYEMVQADVPGLTPDQYQTLKDLDVELQIEINKLVENQVGLFNQQHKTPKEAYITILHTLEAEIETLIQNTFTGTRPELKRYSQFLNNLTNEQTKELKRYLNTILNESVTKKLTGVYGMEASLPQYEVPTYEVVQSEIPNLTPTQYQDVKELDLQLQTLINKLTEKQIKLVEQQNVTPEQAYTIVLHSLEAEIQNLVRGTVQGTRPELEEYTKLIKNKLNKNQYQQLQEYLNIILTESVTRRLSSVYGVTPKPSEETSKAQITDLDEDQYEIVKRVENELQEYITSIADKQIAVAEEQHITPTKAYTTLVKQLEDEIQPVVQGTIQGNNPALTKYHDIIKNKFSRKQMQQLNGYLSISLTNTIIKKLNKTYLSSEAPVDTLPTYQVPPIESLQSEITGLTNNQYETVKEVNTDLQQQVNELIRKQVKIAEQKHLSPEETYQIVLHSLEAELETLVKSSLGGNRPGLQSGSLQKFNKKQLQELDDYLSKTLTIILKRQLTRIYHIRDASTPDAQYTVTRVKLENITSAQYKIIKDIENQFIQYINEAITNQDLSLYADLSAYDQYQVLSSKIETEIGRKLSEFIRGSPNPQATHYSELIERNFPRSKVPDVEKYLQIRLIKVIRQNLSEKFGVSMSNMGSSFESHSTQQIVTHYANVGQTDEMSGQTQELEPVSYQHATVVNSGSARPRVHFEDANVDEVEIISHTPSTTTTTQSSGWWSSIGQKVKGIKDKVIG